MTDGTWPSPIDTHYKNCRFRSRLEARWAVFFDMCGLRWEYEREGFKDDDGNCYLPDFWMPDIETWVEIKPDLRPAGIEWTAWWPLAWPVPLDLEPRLVVLFGSPGDYNGYLTYDRDYRWVRCLDCGRANLEYEERSYRGTNHTDDCCTRRLGIAVVGDKGYWRDTDYALASAVQVAMSERFERKRAA